MSRRRLAVPLRSVRDRVGLERPLVAILVSAALLLGTSLLTHPINHDEGQYVGAIALMRSGLPYRDFAYLQTPLQPLLLAPLSLLHAGWLLVGARVANALFGWLSLALLLFGLRGHTPPWVAIAAVVALACTDVFLFGCSVARNDALPMMLLSGAVALLLQPGAPGKRSYLAAGLLLGLAASAKISFALPAAGAGLFLLVQGRKAGWQPILLFPAGGVAGLLPTAATLGSFAPDLRVRDDRLILNITLRL